MRRPGTVVHTACNGSFLFSKTLVVLWGRWTSLAAVDAYLGRRAMAGGIGAWRAWMEMLGDRQGDKGREAHREPWVASAESHVRCKIFLADRGME